MSDWPDAENTFVSHAAAGEQPRPGTRVRIVEGPDAPREAMIPRAGLTIGSGADCALRLTDKRVSRRHVHVLPEGDGFRVRDLGSSNGTFLDEARIEDALAPAGATLRIGKTAIRLVGPERYLVLPPSARTAFGELLGTSLRMREVFGVLERAAQSHASVLVEGETGTGKELVARALHSEGPRKAGPFVAVDCGAIAANLIESELFGHVRGAFTGASETRAGVFERADRGTLFLDELGELPVDLQPKLLRVLETREVRKVGGTDARAVDVRVIAGTNRNLEEMVEEGQFRADLYYRLAVVHVSLPALRTRLEDLPLLVGRFLARAGIADPGPIDGPNLALLGRHGWPGNVRELRNVLERAIACAGPAPRFADLPIHLGRQSFRDAKPPQIDVSVPFSAAKEQLVDQFERAYLVEMLRTTDGNVTEASRRAGLNRRHLYDLLKKHGIRA